MEALKEPISVRVERINSQITGKTNQTQKCEILSREALLDALQALYDECCIDNLQKFDQNITLFVEKHKNSFSKIKQLRVNINDFEIKNVIGRGHFGEVHVVQEKQTGDVYAMKTIKKSDSSGRRTSFEEERNIMAFSHSSWLTSLQYAFQDSRNLFFIMEYHPGGDLLGLLHRQGTLPESAATFYVAELVLALEDLHKMGYVHRDIKPDNILLDRCGHLKLADFGSAAKLNNEGLVNEGPPVGTPDYIAPEVLQSVEGKNKDGGYGIACDFWSLGVLAYELTVGNTPFTGQNTTMIYSKIMNHNGNLKFPSDITLTQAFVSFIKSLIVDKAQRLSQVQIKNHALFKNTNFDTLRDQVPPFVPKIVSVDDTSNFSDIQKKKNQPSMENFKKKTQFSGRNLPFIGFTFTHDPYGFEGNFERKTIVKDEAVQNLKSEVASLRRKLVKSEEVVLERESLEKKLEEKCRKLESIENLRDGLERDVANNIAECTALKRTLELERKERSELERKALDLIKSAKLKWETAEKSKVDALTLEIDQLNEKISQLTNTNNILNQQLQHALKLETKAKESFEKVQNFNRRSVIGLESRLEKVTSETQNTIANLQSKLSDETHNRLLLENQLIKLKDNESKLLKRLKETEEEYSNLKEKVDEAEDVIKTLGRKVNSLEEDVQNIEELKEEIEKLQSIVDNSHKTIKDLENKNTLLQLEIKTLESQKVDIEEMKQKKLKMQNDKKIEELESMLAEEKEKNVSMKKQLQASENTSTENQELRELRTKFWRMEKELGNAKVDKRILERELKDAQAEIKQLTQEISNLNEKIAETKKIQESAMLELGNINETLSLELIKTKESLKSMQERLNNEKEKTDEEKNIVNELKNIAKSKDDKINQLGREIDKLKLEKIRMEDHIKKIEGDKGKLLQVLENLQKEKGDIMNHLEKREREINNVNLNLEALREACTLLESQVIEYEKINASYQMKQASLNENTEKLINDLCKAKQDIQEAKRLTNEEKSLKLLAETKVKRLTEDLECLQNECSSYKQQCFDYRQYSAGLADELTIAEEKITELEAIVKSHERQIEDFVSENNILKEEVSEYLTQVHNLKESNYKLSHQISELRATKTALQHQIRELERILNEKTAYFNERELKADSTIKQQIKLIDFLQSKIDEQSQKKKTLSDMLFGHSKKENQPPISLAMNYKDLETQLLKERQNNKNLQEEIYKLKAEISLKYDKNVLDRVAKVERHRSEIVSPKTRIAMRELVNSPNSQKGDFYRQNSVQRMHHNIPHRFESKLCTKPTKCANCSNQIMLGRNLNVCKECDVVVHPNCATSLPRTCGLPQAFAKHFKESLNKLGNGDKFEEPSEVEEVVNVEGWLKIPGKSGTWEKTYAIMSDTTIKIYTQLPSQPDSKLIDSFNLKPENSKGKVSLEPLPSEIGVAVANSDLPFVLKVEVAPETTCWPPKCLVFMTLSPQDTEKWFQGLQKVLNQDSEKGNIDTILALPENLQLNFVTDLTDKITLLATQKGLYSHHEQTLLKIDGLDEVHQISIVPHTNLVAMIANSKRILVSCDLNHLIELSQCAPCTKPSLIYRVVNVNSLNGFHLIQTSKFEYHKKICIATSKQLIILSYEIETNDFVPVRILDTAEPTSCVLFAENSIIVGANKFFEIDLQTFHAEEFLDVSDVKLKQAVKCYKMGSFPLAVMQVSKNPKEYLLCFNEFSIFVDEYGRSSRTSEIKSSHLPLAFHFIKPYLYVVQFSAVEIIKITEETCNQDLGEPPKLEVVRVELEKIRNVGSNKKGVYICQGDELKFLEAKKFVDSDLSSIISDNTSANESDRFSFSSSMMQSLDGNLSDSESVADTKKVKFSQTNL